MKQLTEKDFQTTLQQNRLVLVDFWAAWCGPCRMIAPALDALDKELGNEVVFAKVNVDEQPVLAQQFGILSIPTLILFKNGQIVEKSVGVVSKAEIAQIIKKHL